MTFMNMHTCISIVAGFCLDLIIGDPYFFPHPIRGIGKLIEILQKKLLIPTDSSKSKRLKGICLVLLVTAITAGIAQVILLLAYRLHPIQGLVVETIMCYQILAAKCLKTESMKVYNALHDEDLDEARKAVSMIVGRDTQNLSARGVARAAVETVAENTSDGIIGPLFYLAIGGPILGFAYKAINTMDSMLGYKNEIFIDFGRAAAKLDDVVNVPPARISAWLMIAVSFFLGMDTKNAIRIYRRDRFCHSSPNSAHTESAAAGALRLQLAGDAWYFGKRVKKPVIGDNIREIEAEDIIRVNSLMYGTAILGMGLFVMLRLILTGWMVLG